MRWNRGTIVLIAALLVVIVAVLVINNNQASAPGETPTPAASTGSLLPITDAGNIARYEVRDNSTGDFAALTKDSGGAWHIDATNALPTRDPDQSLIDTTAGKIVSLKYSNTLATINWGRLGWTRRATRCWSRPPMARCTRSTSATKAPTSPAIIPSSRAGTAASTAEAPMATAEATAEMTVEAAATAEATVEATPNRVANPGVTLSGAQTIYLVPQTVIDTLTKWLPTPPYAPLPTAVPTDIVPLELPTVEPTAAMTAEPTVEMTAEATVAP